MNTFRLTIVAIIASLISVVVMGCATTGPGNEIIARVGVQYATLKVIGDDQVKAAAVVAITDQAITMAAGELVSIDVLEAQVRASIPWTELDLADRQLVELLILSVRAELDNRIEVGQVEANRVAASVEVLQWVHDAAALAAEPAE